MATSDVEDDGPPTELIAAASAATSAVALAAATVLVFDQLAFALAVGAFSGVGSFFLVGYVLRGAQGASGGTDAVETFHRGALGFAASGSGITAFALMFVFENPGIALGGGLGLATMEYLVLSQVLPREPDAESESAA